MRNRAMPALMWGLLLVVRADETYLFEDYSAVPQILKQGSQVGAVVLSEDAVYACGDFRDKTCGLTPQGCSTLTRSEATQQQSNCANSDALIAKYDQAGGLQWITQEGGEKGETCDALAESKTSGIVAAVGSTGPTSGLKLAGALKGGKDAYALALESSTGNIRWARHLGTGGYDSGISVIATSDAVFALGNTEPTYSRLGKSDRIGECFLAKLAVSDGQPMWAEDTISFGSQLDDRCSAMAMVAEGGNDAFATLYVVGRSASDGTTKPEIGGETGKGGSDVLVVRINYLGKLVWSHLFGGLGNDVAMDVTVSDNGASIFVVGYTKSKSMKGNKIDDEEGFVMKLDNRGREVWALTYSEVKAFNKVVLKGTTLFTLGMTTKPLTPLHTKVSMNHDAVLLELDSATGKYKTGTVGSHIGIAPTTGIQNLYTSGLAVATKDGKDKVYVSGNGEAADKTTRGVLFNLAPKDPSSDLVGDFDIQSAPGFGVADEVGFRIPSSSYIDIITKTGQQKIPMVDLPPLAVGATVIQTMVLRRANTRSRRTCVDASVGINFDVKTVVPSAVGVQPVVWTESTVVGLELVSLEIPTVATFQEWGGSQDLELQAAGTPYKSMETVLLSVAVSNKQLNALRKDGVGGPELPTDVVIILSLPSTCTSQGTYGAGCLVDMNTSRIALFIHGEKEISEDSKSRTMFKMIVGFSSLGFFFCVCLCHHYVIAPFRRSSRLEGQQRAELMEQLEKDSRTVSFMKKVARQASFRRKGDMGSPRSAHGKSFFGNARDGNFGQLGSFSSFMFTKTKSSSGKKRFGKKKSSLRAESTLDMEEEKIHLNLCGYLCAFLMFVFTLGGCFGCCFLYSRRNRNAVGPQGAGLQSWEQGLGIEMVDEIEVDDEGTRTYAEAKRKAQATRNEAKRKMGKGPPLAGLEKLHTTNSFATTAIVVSPKKEIPISPKAIENITGPSANMFLAKKAKDDAIRAASKAKSAEEEKRFAIRGI